MVLVNNPVGFTISEANLYARVQFLYTASSTKFTQKEIPKP